MFPILSRNQIKFIRTLKQKKYRYKFKNYVVEGEKLVADMATHRADLIRYLIVDEKYTGKLDFWQSDIFQTDPQTFKLLSNLVQPQGIMALCSIPDEYFSSNWSTSDFTLYFDAIQNPGNLGTMFRTAEWFGISQIMIGKGTVDPFSPKTIQAAMGSHSYLRMYECDTTVALEWPHPVILADMKGENAFRHHWTNSGMLVLGNEGQGISSAFEEAGFSRITIPPAGSVRSESLNVGMACTVLITLRHQSLLRAGKL